MKARCPRCGVGPLFIGMLKMAPACAACGLDLRPYDQGDGPAAFAIFFVAILMVGAALLVQNLLHPPIWVHMVLWGPAIIGVTILSLRIIKTILVAQQYRHLPPTPPAA